MQNKSINHWRATPLDLGFLAAHRLPISDSYRAAVAASAGAATIYDYIRDHLGYRLEFSTAPRASLGGGRALTLTAAVSNYGFAAFANPRRVLLTLQVSEIVVDL